MANIRRRALLPALSARVVRLARGLATSPRRSGRGGLFFQRAAALALLLLLLRRLPACKNARGRGWAGAEDGGHASPLAAATAATWGRARCRLREARGTCGVIRHRLEDKTKDGQTARYYA